MSVQQVLSINLGNLKAENFGPISHADISFGNLTVLAGAQNTGKTYLSILADVISKSLSFFIQNSTFQAIIDTLRASNLSGFISADKVISTVTEKSDKFMEVVDKQAQLQAQSIAQQFMPYYLVTKPTDLISQGKDFLKVEAQIKLASAELSNISLLIRRDGSIVASLRPVRETILSLVRVMRAQITIMGAGSSAQYASIPTANTMYIPAERFVIIPVFSQLLNLLLVIYRGITQPGIMPVPVGAPVPQLRQSTLNYLTEVQNALSAQGSYSIMDLGSIQTSTGQIFFNDSKRNVTVPISGASSGIAQLAGMMLPIERLHPSFLIIEEPEVNLHPDSQLKVAEYLARISENRRILVTTHSHYLLAKLANLYGKKQIGDLRAYFIDPDTSQTRALDINRETGEAELPPSIEAALESLASEAITLSKEYYGSSA